MQQFYVSYSSKLNIASFGSTDSSSNIATGQCHLRKNSNIIGWYDAQHSDFKLDGCGTQYLSLHSFCGVASPAATPGRACGDASASLLLYACGDACGDASSSCGGVATAIATLTANAFS